MKKGLNKYATRYGAILTQILVQQSYEEKQLK